LPALARRARLVGQPSLGVPDLKAFVVKPNRSPIVGTDPARAPVIGRGGRQVFVRSMPPRPPDRRRHGACVEWLPAQGAPGLGPPTHAVRRERLARDVLQDWDDERDGHRWERTPWHATQRVAWDALNKAEEGRGGQPLIRRGRGMLRLAGGRGFVAVVEEALRLP
jgi:hypothetical protein